MVIDSMYITSFELIDIPLVYIEDAPEEMMPYSIQKIRNSLKEGYSCG